MHVTIFIGVLVSFFAALELWLVHFEPNYPAKEPEDEALRPGQATPIHHH
jgi:hypothetical protein